MDAGSDSTLSTLAADSSGSWTAVGLREGPIRLVADSFGRPASAGGGGAGADHLCDNCTTPAMYQLTVLYFTDLRTAGAPMVLYDNHCMFCYDHVLQEIGICGTAGARTQGCFLLSSDRGRLIPPPTAWLHSERLKTKEAVALLRAFGGKFPKPVLKPCSRRRTAWSKRKRYIRC